MYWHSYFNINDFDENADYAVFDDIAGGSSSSLITKDGWVHKNIHCDRQVPGEEAYRLGEALHHADERGSYDRFPTLTPLGYLGTVTLFLYQTTNQ